jgi:steroid 5-alpha reductase family enzyme
LNLSALVLVVYVAAGLMLVMALAWLLQRSTKNGAWADVFWTFGLGAAGCMLALYPLAGKALTSRQWLVAALVAFWSLRLGFYILSRTLRAGQEDPRYLALRREWGRAAQSKMFLFFEIQAFAGILLAITMLLAARNPTPGLQLSDLIGAAIFIVAVVGEGISDAQLSKFKFLAKNKNKICDYGFWSWSRHPNYFFEWLGWVAYPIIAISFAGNYPWGWLALIGPAYMYWLLNYVSGVPLLEQHMLRKHGAKFRAYQARVSAFFPLPEFSKKRSSVRRL